MYRPRGIPDYCYLNGRTPYYLNDPPKRWPKVLMGVMALGMVAGVVGIVFVSVQLWHGIEKVEAQREAMHAAAMPSSAPSPTLLPPVEEEPADEDSPFVWENRPATGEKIGTLLIPRIDAQIPIWEGTGDKELGKGVGHHESSVLPGEPDNAVLAGHRETAFRRAKEIRKGDELQVKTDDYTFTFQVTKKWVAEADDPSVVASNKVGESRLITYTCWPVEAVFSGYAPKRYIIESELTHIEKH